MVNVSSVEESSSDSKEEESEEDKILGVKLGYIEDNIKKSQTLDTIKLITSMRLTSNDLSWMRILLCKLVPMPTVQPTLSCDLTLFDNKFTWGYKEGARVFYISISDEEGKLAMFSDKEKQDSSPLWNSMNDEFNEYLKLQDALKFLVDKKFFVCDGNHK